MALKRNERYPGRFANPNAAHPQGAFKNRTSPTSQDGSYLESDWANDWDGFFARLLTVAGVTANGNVDTGTSSQYYDALMKIALQRSNPFGDIKLDGNTAVATALSNIGLGTKVLSPSGFIRIPDIPGGMILQWGQVSASISEGPQSVTFPTPFPTSGRFATAIPINQSGLTTIDIFSQLQSLTTSSVTFFFSWGTSSTPGNGFQWFALGY